MIKVIVCRVGEELKVEEVARPYYFTRDSVLGGAYIEAKMIWINDKDRVVVYWDEDASRKNLPFNRYIPVKVLPPAIKPNFVVDMRKGPPEHYAKEGDVGFFPIHGNFVVTKADKQGDHVSLSEEEVATVFSLLGSPP